MGLAQKNPQENPKEPRETSEKNEANKPLLKLMENFGREAEKILPQEKKLIKKFFLMIDKILKVVKKLEFKQLKQLKVQKIKEIWFDLIVRPLQGFKRSMTFRIIFLFLGTWLTASTIVYYAENLGGNKDQFGKIWDGLWWGIVTITTTGYGDKYPGTFLGRFFAGITMITGIITAGIVTGNIASWLVDLRMKEARGMVDLTGKRGHLIICGWRREMNLVLEEIFNLNPDFNPEDIVIIAPIDQETMDSFKSQEQFAQVNIIRGEFFAASILHHAAIKDAKKVLILSDWSKPVHSMTEVDAKTIMTAMTIEKIAPAVYVAAELIDTKFESYLRIAHCDEIIHSKEYSRILLANSTAQTGLAHVVYDLLNVATPAHISTVDVPEEFISKSFGDLATYFLQVESNIAIGLLENTGNLHTIKKEALSEAQKNPDTRTVLKNLAEVKRITTNLPVLNPPRDYIVKKYSRVVIIGNKKTTQGKEAV